MELTGWEGTVSKHNSSGGTSTTTPELLEQSSGLMVTLSAGLPGMCKALHLIPSTALNKLNSKQPVLLGLIK